MTINPVNNLQPNKDGCKLDAHKNQFFEDLQKEVNILKEALNNLKIKVDGRDEVIDTKELNTENANVSKTLSTSDLVVSGTSSLQGKTTVNDIDVNGVLNIANISAILADLDNLIANKIDIQEADIKSAIVDILKIKVALKRFDTNQDVISFPGENTTQIGDFANSIILGGLSKPQWNNELLITNKDLEKDYYNQTTIDAMIDAETADSIRRETDIIKGNTPVQKVSAGAVDTDGNVIATSDDAFMLYGAQGRDNIPRDSSLNDLVTCGQYSAWKPDVANTIQNRPEKEDGPFDLTVGYSISDSSYPYQVYTGLVRRTMYIRFFNKDLREFDAWQQFQFMGGISSRPLDVGNAEIYIRPEYENEVNFYGTSSLDNIIFGKRGNKKNVYTFGEGASAEVEAKNFLQNGKQVATLEDNVASATTHKSILISGKDFKINDLNNSANVYGNIYTGLSSDWLDSENLPEKARGSHGFALEILPNKSNTVQRYTVNVSRKMYIYERLYDNNTWAEWQEIATLDIDGYVEKAKLAKNLEAGAKIGNDEIAIKNKTLFGTTGTMKDGDDFNDFLTNGVYFSPRDGLNLINKPTQPTGGKLIVESLINETSKSYIKQTWIPVTVNGTWVRKYSVDRGKWWDWEKEITVNGTVENANYLIPQDSSTINDITKSGTYAVYSPSDVPQFEGRGLTVLNQHYADSNGSWDSQFITDVLINKWYIRTRDSGVWGDLKTVATIDGTIKKATRAVFDENGFQNIGQLSYGSSGEVNNNVDLKSLNLDGIYLANFSYLVKNYDVYDMGVLIAYRNNAFKYISISKNGLTINVTGAGIIDTDFGCMRLIQMGYGSVKSDVQTLDTFNYGVRG